MAILVYVLMAVAAVCAAVGAAVFQYWYRSEEKPTVQEAIAAQKSKPVTLAVFLVLYVAFMIVSILFYQQKNVTLSELIQYNLCWEGVMLISWIDFRIKKIPNVILLLLLAVRCIGLLVDAVQSPDQMIASFLSAGSGFLLGGFVILFCMLISRGGIGAGDVKLFAVLGLYTDAIGIMNILFYTVFFSCAAAIVLLIGRKAKMKSSIAMAPFAFLGLNIYYILL